MESGEHRLHISTSVPSLWQFTHFVSLGLPGLSPALLLVMSKHNLRFLSSQTESCNVLLFLNQCLKVMKGRWIQSRSYIIYLIETLSSCSCNLPITLIKTLQILFIFNKQIVIYRPWGHTPALSIFCLMESTCSCLPCCSAAGTRFWGCDDPTHGVCGCSSSWANLWVCPGCSRPAHASGKSHPRPSSNTFLTTALPCCWVKGIGNSCYDLRNCIQISVCGLVWGFLYVLVLFS